MKYQIKIEKDAQKFLKKLPRPDETRVLKAIAKLPDEGDRKQMKGHPGFFRLRVGDYRIIYTVDNGQLIVRVVDAGTRGQIYCSATRPGINANTKSETTDPDTQTSTITVSPMANGTIKAHTADDVTPATLNGWYTSVTLPTDAT